jgi:hypothetical protein
LCAGAGAGWRHKLALSRAACELREPGVGVLRLLLLLLLLLELLLLLQVLLRGKHDGKSANQMVVQEESFYAIRF